MQEISGRLLVVQFTEALLFDEIMTSGARLDTACSSAQALRSLCKHGRRYVKISGEGPDHGWVSLRVGSKQLLRHVDVVSSTRLRTRSFGSPGLILCIGDSLTAGGYPTLLQGLFSVDSSLPVVVKDFGVRGASVLPMAGGPCVAYSSLARLDAELRCNPPDAIIVMLGTNDARSAHWNAEAFQLEYCALLHRLEGLELETDAVGSRRLVLIAVPPRVTSNAWGIDVDIADNDLANAVEVVAQKMGMALVNLRDVLDPIAAFVSDGVHLTQAASALVAENAKRALLAASGAEAVLAKSHSAGYKEPMLHRNSTGD
eukprot:s3234_g18.t1